VIEFEEYVRLMKQSWVMLRVVKKICDEISGNEFEKKLVIEADEVEWRLLKIYY